MKTWFYSFNSSLIRMLAGVGVLAIYARYLPMEEYSTIAIALLVGQIITIVLDAGINSEILTTRLIDLASTLNQRLAEAATIKIALCIPVLIGYIAIIDIEQKSWGLFFFTALSVPIAASIENYATALKAQRRYKFEFITSLLQAVAVVSFAFMLIWNSRLAIVAIFAPRLLVLIILSFSCFKTEFRSFYSAINPKAVTQFFIRSRHFSLDSIVSNMLNQIDGIAISSFLGKDVYGAYQPASRLMMAGIGLGSAVGGVVIPRARNLVETETQKKYLFVSFAYAGGIFSIGLLIFLIFFLEPIFGTLYKPKNIEIVLLSLILLLKYLSAGVGAHLSILGKQRTRAITNTSSIVICSLLLIVLHNSVKEVLLAITLSQIFVLISYEISARKYVKKML